MTNEEYIHRTEAWLATHIFILEVMMSNPDISYFDITFYLGNVFDDVYEEMMKDDIQTESSCKAY